jgi:hypothetical protein
MRSWIRLFAVALGLLTFAGSAFAQGTGRSLDIQPGARQNGMGAAGVALPEDATGATWWNPAGLGFLDRGSVDLTYAQLVPGLASDPGVEDARREIIKAFYGDFFFWVNLVGFIVQAFLVSRIIRWIGVRGALFIMPVVAFGTYGAIAVIGGLAITKAMKVAENSTDYSLHNTVRQALFLPTSRDAKYKAKAAIDVFFVRFGDTISALVVGVGLHSLGMNVRGLAFVNVALIAVWIVVVIAIARRHKAFKVEEGKDEKAKA